ncbi:calcium-binding protein [Planktotalea sp.]|uniref:calcium-binding protein n=1 Tax=Planktotalea sp. TaxID=2029877 RepID=UPI003D6A3E09
MLVYMSILGAIAASATYFGGDTNDTIHGTEFDDTVDGGAGDDSIHGGLGNDLLDGGVNNDWILGGSGADTIVGGSGDDFLAGDDGDDVIDTGLGINTVYAGEGDDTITSEGSWSQLNGGDGQDWIEATNTGYRSNLLGGDGNDVLIARNTNPAAHLDGGAGDDILFSDFVSSEMTGGEGSDFFVLGSETEGEGYEPPHIVHDYTLGIDQLVIPLSEGESAEDFRFEDRTQYYGTMAHLLKANEDGSTTIVARFTGVLSADIPSDAMVFLAESDLDAFFTSQDVNGPDLSGGEDSDGGDVSGDNSGDNSGEADGPDMTEGVDNSNSGVFGGAQTLTGTQFDDTLFGGLANDSIFANAGDDWIAGDDGSDTIDGDAGVDTIYAGDGNDLVRVEGSVNEIFAGTGEDILWTTGGAIMTGGEGGDYFLAGSDLTLVTDFDPAEDTIVVPFVTDGTYTLGADPETSDTQLLLDGDVIMQLSGVASGTIALSDVALLDEEETYAFLNSQGVDGPSLPEPEQDPFGATLGDDNLMGTVESDLINALGGSDTIDGDTGADTLYGGEGNDLLRTEGRNNELFGDAGDDILWSTGGGEMTGGEGGDYFLAGSDLTLLTDFDPVEDTIVVPFSGDGDYTLGADPETGDAQLRLDGDVILQISGVAAGTITMSDIAFLDEEETYAFLNSQGVDGPSLPEPEVSTVPTEGDDRLLGTELSDSINALGGNDTIDGGDGADTLEGGLGNDLIFAGSASEAGVISRTSTGYLPLVASAGDRLIGHEGDDTLVGDIANAYLYGGDGDDVLYGGEDGRQLLFGNAGDDILVGGNGINQVTSWGVGGVYSSGSYMYGGEGDDVLVNNSGYGIGHPLAVRAGAIGGEGADVFIDQVGGSRMSIDDFDREEDIIILTVPDGTVLPANGGLEFSYQNYVAHSRYLLAQSDLLITVRDVDGVSHSGAKLVDFREIRYSPSMQSMQATSNPFDAGAVVVMTQSEAETYWEPKPISA